jgi:sensor histidine kinase YesM
MEIGKYLKNHKLSFWHYQIVGWFFFMANELLREYRIWFDSLNNAIYLLLTWAVLFILTLGLRYVYRIVYNLRKQFLLSFVFIIFISIVCSFLWHVIRLTYQPYLLDPALLENKMTLFNKTLLSAWVPVTWSILYFGIKYWYDLQEESERAKALLLNAAKAQLQMLRYQINPHFLFNSLNSIKALTYENPEQAALMLTELSEFLRFSLSYDVKVFVPVREEIEIIEKYLHIEKIRFEERLNYNIYVDRAVMEREVPCFITQPLVENAIKHGLSHRPQGIDLSISFTRNRDHMVIEVANSGVFGNDRDFRGTGLKNIAERLDNAYGNQYSLTITDQDDMVRVTVSIPEKL